MIAVSGKQMSVVLRELKEFWVDNDCNVKADELLKLVPDILQKAKDVKK